MVGLPRSCEGHTAVELLVKNGRLEHFYMGQFKSYKLEAHFVSIPKVFEESMKRQAVFWILRSP